MRLLTLARKYHSNYAWLEQLQQPPVWGMYNWNPFKDAHRWRYCNRLENSSQTFWQDPHMHKLAYHVCKEFLRLLPTQLYLGHPHNIHLECVVSEHFIHWCENVKTMSVSLGSTGCMSTSHSMACSQPWTLWATWGWTLLCSSWCLHYVLPDICYWLWYIAVKVCDSNGVHRLCCYMVLSPKTEMAQCQRT